MPQVAAVASWLENLKMPIREMNEVYTKSELGIMGWRSGEVASNMQSDHPKVDRGATQALEGATGRESDPVLAALEERLGPVAAKLDEDLDLRKLTGEEVMRYMRALNIPIGGRMLTSIESSPVVTAYRKEGL